MVVYQKLSWTNFLQNIWNQKFNYKSISRVTDRNGARFYSCDGNKVPSVTTILDKTKSQKDRDSLNSWREKVGYVEASKISKASMLRGDKMHKHLEDVLHGKQELDLGESLDIEKQMSQVIVDKINPISIEIKKLLNDNDYLDEILSEGCKKANVIASEKIKKIHDIVGF